MSDQPKDENSVELDLDWDDALADLEKEIDEGVLTAESAPMPQKSAPKVAARPLYQPPSPEELARMKSRGGGRETAPPPASHVVGSVGYDEDEDEDEGRTMVGVLSEQVRNELLARSEPPPRATARPPSDTAAENESPARNSAVDLDFDGLLDGLDNETSLYPAEVPRVMRASQSVPAVGSAAATPPAESSEEPLAPTPAIGQLRPDLSGAAKPAPKPPLPRPSLPRPPMPGAPPFPPRVPAPPGGRPVPPPVGRGASALAAAIAAKRAANEAKAAAEAKGPAAPKALVGVPSPFAPAPPLAAPLSAPQRAAVAAEADAELDDVLAALDQEIESVRPAPRTAAEATSSVEEAFFRPAVEAPVARSIVDELSDLDESPASAPASAPVSAPIASDEEVLIVGDSNDESISVVEDAAEDDVLLVAAEAPDDAVISAAEPDDAELVISPAEDDDAEVVIAAEEDDAEVVISAAEDDDADMVISAATDDEVDGEGQVIEMDAPGPAPAQPAGPDRGAAAARRSVRSRKPRKELFPLVGRTPAHRSARADLLEALASKSSGVHAARLLVAASELRRGTESEAGMPALLERALSTAPTDPTALRAARARALATGDRDRFVSLFAQEAEGPSRLSLLAQLSLFELGNAEPSAMRACQERLGPAAGVSLLLPLDGLTEGPSEARERALAAASAGTTDQALNTALGLLSAASTVHRDDVASMRTLGDGLGDAGILIRARARARGAESDVAGDGLGRVLQELGPLLGDAGASVAEAGRRLGALSELEHGRVDEALQASRSASSAPFLRVWARAAAVAGNVDEEIEALSNLAQKTGSTERATSLSRVAELRLGRGELDLAEEALRAASLADPELAAPRVVRAQLSLLDPARAARTATAPEPGTSMAAKAVYADIAQERSALSVAEHEDDAPLAADVLGLDVAAELNLSAREAVDPLLLGLRRHAERLPLEERTGALLSFAIEARTAGRDEEAHAALEEARAARPDSELVLTELARVSAPSDAAAALLGASAACSDVRRASGLALEAARVLENASAEGPAEGGTLEVLSAARRATDADATNDVAWLSLSRAAKGAGDAGALAEAEEMLGELSSTDRDAAAHLVRAALARAGEDPQAAGGLLQRAREKAPRDLVLFALSMRLGEGLPDTERAAQLEASLDDAPPALASALALAAASAYEAVGDHEGAARVLGRPSDASAVGIASARARALLGAGQFSELRSQWLERSRTGSVAEQITALEALVQLEEREGGDRDSARAAQGAILELSATHLPALRWLERNAMVAGREDDLLSIERQMVESLEEPSDAMAHLRTAVRLVSTRSESNGESADALLLANHERVPADLWLSRRLVAAARAAGDAARTAAAEKDLVGRVSRPMEQASLALRAAESAEAVGALAADRAAILAEVEGAAPEHPVLHAELARLLDLLGDAEKSAAAWHRAGEASLVPGIRAAAYYRAGVLFEDQVGDEERALTLYELAAEADVTHADVFSRAQRILERRGEVDRLNALLAKRLSAGGDAAGLVELHLAQAKLRVAAGDKEAGKTALRSALELNAEHPIALKRLAELCLETQDHRGAADALIRLARVRKDREELRWVFFALGDIYDLHIPDPRRAEAAWKRVLKLAPDDLPSMERLASLYLREGPKESAVAQLEELIKVEPDPDRAREHHLALSRVLEDSGDARRAEQVLEAARRAAPTDLTTLKAMADLYTRQRAQPALAMHLNRAVSDFRHALSTDVSDTAAWLGLVEVLSWRRREDAARVAASAATAMGIVDVELSRLLDQRGGAPGVPAALGDESVEDAIAPPSVTGPLRAVFRALGSALEKVTPFDPRNLRAEKLGPRDTTIRPMVQEIARSVGIDGEVEIWVAAGTPRACLPVQSTPPVLVVGRDLLSSIDEDEKRFLVGRALKIAKAQLSLVMRSAPGELAMLLAGLVLNADPNYEHGLDPAEVQEWARRVARTVPRRALEDNGPLLFEMAGAPEHDPARLPLGVAELGSRTALLATGAVPPALSALVKMVIESGLPADATARAAALRQVPEAGHLLDFAISDAHFEIRTRAGADRL